MISSGVKPAAYQHMYYFVFTEDKLVYRYKNFYSLLNFYGGWGNE